MLKQSKLFFALMFILLTIPFAAATHHATTVLTEIESR
jgi:hypothetical protein